MLTEIRFPGLGLSFDPPTDLPFTVFGHDIKWYGVVIAIGFLLAVTYGLVHCEKFGFSRDDLIDVVIISAPVGIICARLYFCFFYNAAYYLEHPIEILFIWNGGLAIYGGIIGGLVTAAIVAHVKKIRSLAILDLASIGFPLAQAIGRWGNFFNREAFGAVTDSFLRMEIATNSAVNDWDPIHGTMTAVHPCFLYECAWNLIGFGLLHLISKKRKFDGQIFLLYVIWYGIGRFLIEGLRTDSLLLPGTSLRVSQMIAAASALVGITLLVFNLLRRPDPKQMQVGVYERSQARKALAQAAQEMSAYTASMVDSSASADIEPDDEITFDNPPAPEDDEGIDPLSVLDGLGDLGDLSAPIDDTPINDISDDESEDEKEDKE